MTLIDDHSTSDTLRSTDAATTDYFHCSLATGWRHEIRKVVHDLAGCEILISLMTSVFVMKHKFPPFEIVSVMRLNEMLNPAKDESSSGELAAGFCPAKRIPSDDFEAALNLTSLSRGDADQHGSMVYTEDARFGEPPKECFHSRPSSHILLRARLRSNDNMAKLARIENLSECEQHFCCLVAGIKPEAYLSTRRKIFQLFHESFEFDEQGNIVRCLKSWCASRAQTVKGIDANKISMMYKWYNELGLWKHAWPRKD